MSYIFLVPIYMMIDLNERQLCDLEMLMIGGFAPLTGFLTQKDYISVVEHKRLSDGTLWPMPIVLHISEETKNKLIINDSVILRNSANLPIARLLIKDIYKPDIQKECLNVYGTTDTNHPYVKILTDLKDPWYVGGDVIKINDVPHYDFSEDRLTPAQAKEFFASQGWTTIVGFQTRNPMHRSHYELTIKALQDTNVPDAKLLLQPVAGVTQEEDIDYYTRVKCYKKLLQYYPPNTVKLSLLPLSMRMAGPVEALWHAIIRKNYGCTHFIIGRDHAGPSSKKQDGSSFYGPYDAHALLEKYQHEVGIKIIKSQMILYVEELDKYLPADQIPKGLTAKNISGTQQRELLRTSKEIPSWFTFPSIVEELKKAVVPMKERGFCIYLVGLPSSGKTTVALALEDKLRELLNKPITLLDGDIVRKHLSKGLGFSKEDRSTNIRRIGYVASEIVKHRGVALCANIAPFDEDRQWNRQQISRYGSYIEVFMNTNIGVCEDRDVKGLYKLARQGTIKNMTGVDDPFEEPKNSDIIITEKMTLQETINVIINKLQELGHISSA
jgi:sulfate adenylyltransferase